ncbi:restriction endonuclease subunit S [Nitrosomonas sp.]|uniref:restriction endonuclease subunit S n=1 Tax=Nitrosomonas sp. TaxID=42353 RepID=UPI00272FAE25|nr:restriction endonuclease subunit S [Nitrosomonas sp.]
MAVRPGYKQTEVGMIPEDWDVKSLGDIGDCLIGLTYSPNNVRDHGTLVLRSSNIQDGSLTFDDNVYVDAVIPERIVAQDGDILICVRNGSRRLIGKCALLDNRVAGQTFGAFMSVFRTPESAFVFYQFQSDLIKRQIDENIGATINQITNANLNAFKIPLPSSSQERITIAAALSDVDALLAKLDQFIAKKRDLKQAAMQQLLTGQTRLPGFSGEWEVKSIGELCDYQNGTSLEQFFNQEDGFKVISIGNYSVTGKFVDNGVYINIKHRKLVEKFILRRNDLTMSLNDKTSVGAIIGRVLLIDQDDLFVFNQRTMRLRPKEIVSPSYLHHAVNADRSHSALVGLAKPGTQIYINTDDVIDLKLSVPPLPEQTAIATVLSDMDAELAALEARRDKTSALKQGMMQELLTGRIRLV